METRDASINVTGWHESADDAVTVDALPQTTQKWGSRFFAVESLRVVGDMARACTDEILFTSQGRINDALEVTKNKISVAWYDFWHIKTLK
jgi:hypothetical protein